MAPAASSLLDCSPSKRVRLSSAFLLFCGTREGAQWRERGRSLRSWSPTSSATAGSPGRTRMERLARLRGATQRSGRSRRSPRINGRIVKRTGDGSLIEFRSVVDAVRCAIEVQNGLIERNAGVPPERRIEFRVGIHLGDVVEEGDGDLMGDGVNIAARLEGIARARRDLSLRGRLSSGEGAARSRGHTTSAQPNSRTSPSRSGSIRSKSASRCRRSPRLPQRPKNPPRRAFRSSSCRSPISEATRSRSISSTGSRRALTTDLSRIRGAVVIARNTAFTYKGKPLDVKTIGRELNVRYVLEGSVQRGGNRMRVNVQLIDAETGSHLWAERFDKPLADLFDMQDEIVARLANALNAQLVAAEARRAEQAPTPDSMDLYFQGLAWFNKGLTPDNRRASAQLLRSRADRRSRQCRRAHWIGDRGGDRRRKFLCDRSRGVLSLRPKRS